MTGVIRPVILSEPAPSLRGAGESKDPYNLNLPMQLEPSSTGIIGFPRFAA